MLQALDQLRADGQRLVAESDHPADATGGAQRGPVVQLAELDEQVTGEQGFLDQLLLPPQQAFATVPRAVAGVALAEQVFLGALVLARLALDQIPGVRLSILWLFRREAAAHAIFPSLPLPFGLMAAL
ncbi:hypothetical protein D3C86_1600310 [compost metagenome]